MWLTSLCVAWLLLICGKKRWLNNDATKDYQDPQDQYSIDSGERLTTLSDAVLRFGVVFLPGRGLFGARQLQDDEDPYEVDSRQLQDVEDPDASSETEVDWYAVLSRRIHEVPTGNSTNSTNSSNSSTEDGWRQVLTKGALGKAEVIFFVLLSPAIAHAGADMVELLQALNAFVVSGIGGLFERISVTSIDDPMMLVDIAQTILGAVMTATASLQNSITGNRIQASVVFKQYTSNYLESLYQESMRDVGGCAKVSANLTKKFPRGQPVNCTTRVLLPGGKVMKGEEVVVWIMTGLEYGISAVGALFASKIALLISILNAASLGANMLVAAIYRGLIFLFAEHLGLPIRYIDAFHEVFQKYNTYVFNLIMFVSAAWQLKRRLCRQKPNGVGPFRHWRFRATRARGHVAYGGPRQDTPLKLGALRLRCHHTEVELPTIGEIDYSQPPEDGSDWLVTFPEPIYLTDFALSTGGPSISLDEDPVCWTFAASALEFPPEDDHENEDGEKRESDWYFVHRQTRAYPVPGARHANTGWIPFVLGPRTDLLRHDPEVLKPVVIEMEEKHYKKTGLAKLALVNRTPKVAPLPPPEEAHHDDDASISDEGSTVALLGHAKDHMEAPSAPDCRPSSQPESEPSELSASQREEQKRDRRRRLNQKLLELKAAKRARAVKEANYHWFGRMAYRKSLEKKNWGGLRSTVEPKQDLGSKIAQKFNDLLCILMISNEVVKERSDTTAGKDKPSMAVIIDRARVKLGHHTGVYKKQLAIALKFIFKGLDKKEIVIQGVKKVGIDKKKQTMMIDHTDAYELQTLAADAGAGRYADIGKGMKAVVVKLLWEHPEMCTPFADINNTINTGVTNVYLTLASAKLVKQLEISPDKVRGMLETLLPLCLDDGQELRQGHLMELIRLRKEGFFNDADEPDAEKESSEASHEVVHRLVTSSSFCITEDVQEDDQDSSRSPRSPRSESSNYSRDRVVRSTSAVKAQDGSAAAVRSRTLRKTKDWCPHEKDEAELAKEKEQAAEEEMGHLIKELEFLAAGGGLRAGRIAEMYQLETWYDEDQELKKKKIHERVIAKLKQLAGAAGKLKGLYEKEVQKAGKKFAALPKNAVQWLVRYHTHPEERGQTKTCSSHIADLKAHLHSVGKTAHNIFHDRLDEVTLRRNEQIAVREFVEKELIDKLALTAEQARRLCNAMPEKDRCAAGAAGGMDMKKVRQLADKMGIPINEAKAAERQAALQKFKMEKELARELPPHERKNASKKASNMTPADIANRMSTPEDDRPEPGPDVTEIIKGLKDTVKRLEEDKVVLVDQHCEAFVEQDASHTASHDTTRKKLQVTIAEKCQLEKEIEDLKKHVEALMPKMEEETVSVQMSIENVDFSQLNDSDKEEMERKAKEEFARKAGVHPSTINIALSSGSLKIDAEIKMPEGHSASNVQDNVGGGDMAGNLVDLAKGIDGIQKAATGPLEAGEITLSVKKEIVRAEIATQTDIDIVEVAMQTELVCKDVSMQTELVLEETSMQTELVLQEASMQTELVCEEVSMQTELICEEASMQTELVCEEASMQTEPKGEGIATQTELALQETAMQTELTLQESAMQTELICEEASMQTELICEEASMQTEPKGEGIATQTELALRETAMQTELALQESAMQTQPKEEGIATQTELVLQEVATQTEIHARHVEDAIAGVISRADLLHFLPGSADSKGAWRVIDTLILRPPPKKIHAALEAAAPDDQSFNIVEENEPVSGELLSIHELRSGDLLWQGSRVGEGCLGKGGPKAALEASTALNVVVVFEDNCPEEQDLKCVAGLADKARLLQCLPTAPDKNGVWFPLEPLDLDAAPKQCHQSLKDSTPHCEKMSVLDIFRHVHGQLLRLHDQSGNLLWQSSKSSKSAGSRSPSQALKEAKDQYFLAVVEDVVQEDATQLIAGRMTAADLLRFLPSSCDPGNVWHFTEPVHLGPPPVALHKPLERSKPLEYDLYVLEDEECFNGHVHRILDSEAGIMWKSDSGDSPAQILDTLDEEAEVFVLVEEWLPEKDVEGEYKITGNGGATVGSTVVTKGQTLVGNLDKGTIVNVLEIRAVPKEKRIRGRIENPDGWISLENTESKFRWAVPKHTVRNMVQALDKRKEGT